MKKLLTLSLDTNSQLLRCPLWCQSPHVLRVSERVSPKKRFSYDEGIALAVLARGDSELRLEGEEMS